MQILGHIKSSPETGILFGGYRAYFSFHGAQVKQPVFFWTLNLINNCTKKKNYSKAIQNQNSYTKPRLSPGVTDIGFSYKRRSKEEKTQIPSVLRPARSSSSQRTFPPITSPTGGELKLIAEGRVAKIHTS